jgi:hypothetical protein
MRYLPRLHLAGLNFDGVPVDLAKDYWQAGLIFRRYGG